MLFEPVPYDNPCPYKQVPLKMREVRRWLVHKNKVPCDQNGYYVDGTNPANHMTFADAVAFMQAGTADGLGFALGPDGTGNYWQGIDLDNVEANGLEELANSLPGYVEYSPSGLGCHALGYGKPFDTVKLKGIEAYSSKRYFTVTGRAIGGSL